ncbi:MAG: tRNA pseudouridine(38-40) synthase TruA [Lachnospiraceae bacterium]|nr:tRNA pseudouridine(38-40) synthase TruA [Lachnospiraceae bacterium]MDD3795802.1 tRNA pseudouridine(38-40) synthase TruA [Lachnospiraceae bacterium]
MSTYCITMQYDGSRYNGWQKQGNTPNTIQEKLETVLSRIYNAPVEAAGSGRTDAGVHALGQTASFHISSGQNQYSCQELLQLLNQYLPLDIRILQIEPKEDRFHARLHAVGKIYEYRIDNGAYADVFLRRYAAHIPDTLDIDAMRRAAAHLIGTHDFKSFCANRRMKKSTVRTIEAIDFQQEGTLLTIRFSGDGFLYHMVRLLTGTLIEVGRHQRKADDISSILDAKDYSQVTFTAPAEGLFLVSVRY